MKKRICGLLLAVALCLCGMGTMDASAAVEASAPVCAPKAGPVGTLVKEETVVSYDGQGNRETDTIRVYRQPNQSRSKEFKMTVYHDKTIDLKGVGSILTIKLDADFVYDYNTVWCTRYYSSYDVLMPERIASNEANGYQTDFETRMRTSFPLWKCRIRTYYDIEVLDYNPNRLQPTLSICVGVDGAINKDSTD